MDRRDKLRREVREDRKREVKREKADGGLEKDR